jgi:hypothetical protein
MRFLPVALLVAAIGCSPSSNRPDSGTVAEPDACDGFECRVVDCAKTGRPPTTISGTVYAPNRTLALFGVTVMIPLADPVPFTPGASCARCTGEVPPASARTTVSDTAGKFTLDNVPSGINIPITIQIGKWRRQVTIPMVTECTDNPLTADMTSLPRTQAEGDMPKIAIATGSADALECLVRKIGVADSEFTTDAGTGRVNLFVGNGASSLASTGTALPSATTLWSTVDKLKQYDLAMFSCEGGQNPTTKPQGAMDAVKAYADLGGRAFMSHFHNIWIGGETNNPTHAPAVWSSIASFATVGAEPSTDIIDQINNPKGMSFAAWMVSVQGSSTLGSIPILESRQTCASIDNTKAERWVYGNSGATEVPQNFQFTTPNEAPKEERCGKVVFSDMHVASGSSSFGAFPTGCSTSPMTPQEKALAFMFFDIATCVGQIN